MQRHKAENEGEGFAVRRRRQETATASSTGAPAEVALAGPSPRPRRVRGGKRGDRVRSGFGSGGVIGRDELGLRACGSRRQERRGKIVPPIL